MEHEQANSGLERTRRLMRRVFMPVKDRERQRRIQQENVHVRRVNLWAVLRWTFPLLALADAFLYADSATSACLAVLVSKLIGGSILKRSKLAPEGDDAGFWFVAITPLLIVAPIALIEAIAHVNEFPDSARTEVPAPIMVLATLLLRPGMLAAIALEIWQVKRAICRYEAVPVEIRELLYSPKERAGMHAAPMFLAFVIGIPLTAGGGLVLFMSLGLLGTVFFTYIVASIAWNAHFQNLEDARLEGHRLMLIKERIDAGKPVELGQENK